MPRAPFDPPLLLITDRRRFLAGADGAAPSAASAERRVIEAALHGGVGAVQLREKDLDGGDLLRRALALREFTERAGAKLLVNDRLDVAAAAGAGVHLPERGLAPAEARAFFASVGGPSSAAILIGRSIHSVEEARRSEGADYLLFGPVFDTPSKRAFGPPQGLAALAEVVAATPLPVLAVGGIDASRVAAVLDAGAAGIAVIGAVLDARGGAVGDEAAPAERAARELARALRAGR